MFDHLGISLDQPALRARGHGAEQAEHAAACAKVDEGLRRGMGRIEEEVGQEQVLRSKPIAGTGLREGVGPLQPGRDVH